MRLKLVDAVCMKRAEIVARDQSGVYVRASKGSIIYLNDGESLDEKWEC